MTIYPIACGKLVNFAAFTACYERENTDFDGPSVEDVPRAQFVKDFESWEPEIQALLDVRDISWSNGSSLIALVSAYQRRAGGPFTRLFH